MMAHCLRGYFMMLFGQRAMVSRAERSLAAARTAAEPGVTAREAAHLAALAAWVAGNLTGATGRWEAIAVEWPTDVLALKLAQYGSFYTGESERMREVFARALPSWDPGMPGLRLRARLPCLRPRRNRRLRRGRTRRPRGDRAQPSRYLGGACGAARLRDDRKAA